MINENKEIITKKEKMQEYCNVLKGNATLIAIAIPIVTVICSAIANYFLYLLSCGYYNYFGISSKFVVTYSATSFYQYIGYLALVILYLTYLVFTIRIVRLKGNILWKVVLLFLIPMEINFTATFDLLFQWEWLIANAILLFFQWIMMLMIGYAFLISFNKETIEKRNQKKTEVVKTDEKKKANINKDVRKRWGNKEYQLLGLIMLIISSIVLFGYGYIVGYSRAAGETNFGMVYLGEEEYVVIDMEGDKLVLQRCNVSESTLTISKGTYLSVENNVPIVFVKYDEVLVK